MDEDEVPGASPGKATLQFHTGDVKGARRTTQNFFSSGVAQATYAQLIAGDEEGAWETQKRSLRIGNDIADWIPAIGCGQKGGGLAKIGGGMMFDEIASTTIIRRSQGTCRSIEDALEDPPVGTIFYATYSITKPVIDLVIRPCSRKGGTQVEPM